MEDREHIDIAENEGEPVNFITCRYCSTNNILKNKFCNACGKPLKEKYFYNANRNEGRIRQIIFFFVAMVALLGLYGYTELFNPTLEASLWIELIVGSLILIFAAFNFKETVRLYSFRNVKLSKLMLLSIVMVAFAFLVNYVAGYINIELIGGEDSDMLWIYKETDYPLLLGILFIGFHPAIFEEMAFRGFLFNNMLYFSKPKSVIITTGLLFAFIHFSFISLLWLLPIGLFFGYLRYRYRNLWYSTVCHLVYNSTLVIIEYVNWL